MHHCPKAECRNLIHISPLCASTLRQSLLSTPDHSWHFQQQQGGFFFLLAQRHHRSARRGEQNQYLKMRSQSWVNVPDRRWGRGSPGRAGRSDEMDGSSSAARARTKPTVLIPGGKMESGTISISSTNPSCYWDFRSYRPCPWLPTTGTQHGIYSHASNFWCAMQCLPAFHKPQTTKRLLWKKHLLWAVPKNLLILFISIYKLFKPNTIFLLLVLKQNTFWRENSKGKAKQIPSLC